MFWSALVSQKDQALVSLNSQKDQAMAKKDEALVSLNSQKDEALAKKDEALAKKDETLVSLNAQKDDLFAKLTVAHHKCHLLEGRNREMFRVKGIFDVRGVFPFFCSRISTF